VQAICFCPTRELVVQNLMVLEKMGKYTGITYTSTASGDDLARGSRARIQEQAGTRLMFSLLLLRPRPAVYTPKPCDASFSCVLWRISCRI
jgi:hypothetical protein